MSRMPAVFGMTPGILRFPSGGVEATRRATPDGCCPPAGRYPGGYPWRPRGGPDPRLPGAGPGRRRVAPPHPRRPGRARPRPARAQPGRHAPHRFLPRPGGLPLPGRRRRARRRAPTPVGGGGAARAHARPRGTHVSSPPVTLRGWALILGASSGFGEAVSLAYARAGLNIFGVHLDRKATLANAERIVAAIRALGREARFFNVNAADPDRCAEAVGEMERVLVERGEVGTVRVLVHSLAFGTLKPYIANPMKDAVTQAQMDMTLDVMAHSLVYWTQEVVGRGLMTSGGRVYAMTSSGGARVLPFYGPVSAAKAALES